MKIAIYGYGNLGKGVELSAKQNGVDVVGVFTRRDPSTLKTLTGVKTYRADDILNFKDEIDVVIICGGSATDLPVQTPALAKHFNVVDSFDTHAKIPEHFKNVDETCKQFGTTALISGGWDPGLFSIARLYSGAVLCDGKDYTFWGKGVSQGHSDAIRRIDGVQDAKQYTVPVESALQSVRNSENPTLSARQKHVRECYVVAKDGANKAEIEQKIKTMPNYFADYDTTVTFVSQAELNEKYAGYPHGGTVIRSGKTGLDGENNQVIEFSLKLDSNPEFTASVLVACARAVNRFATNGDHGAKTLFDVPPAYLSPLSAEELRKNLL